MAKQAGTQRTARTSLRAVARQLGVAEGAVRKAIRTGRLERSVGRDANGRPVITDLALAEREWRENRDPAKVRAAEGDGATAVMRRRLILAQAKREELRYQVARRELVPRVETQQAFVGYIVACKTKLLGLPTLAKQRIPTLTVADVAVLDGIVREALEELAMNGGAEART
jgi:hypothetical protein